jgi:hypothetical protein
VAKLQNGPIFQAVKEPFISGYPSEDSLAEGQLGALIKASKATAPALFARIQAEAITNGLQLVLKEKAIFAGDFLTAQLPKLAYFKADKLLGQNLPQGLFGGVSFPTADSGDAFVDAMLDVGLSAALSMVSAVPIVGRFASLFVNLGMGIASMFKADEVDPQAPILVPWAKYSRDSDQDLVNGYVIKLYGGSGDWTPIWLPALQGGTWRYERAGDEDGEKKGARVFAPINAQGVVQWDDIGLGAIPNTMRMAAPVQTIENKRPRETGTEVFALGPQTDGSPNYLQIPEAPIIMDTGSFKPAFAGIAGQLWQQVAQKENPDMYKVRALEVRDAWQEYWGAFFEGGFDALRKAEKDNEGAAMWVWAAMTPYICLIQQNGAKVVLGMTGITRPHGGVLITPRIFEPGHGPATIESRTGALYLESVRELGPPERPHIQIRGALLEDNVEADMAQLTGVGGTKMRVIRGAKNVREIAVKGGVKGGCSGCDANGKIQVYAVPWPTGEELLSYYKPPDAAITTPACEALAKAQRWSLERSLVSAYVRPVKVGGLAPYGAFVGPEGSPGAKLRSDCLALRELLLTHPARFAVNLADVDDIDPAFADKLRKSGVKKMGGGLGLAPTYAPLVDTPGSPPPVIDPAEGLPFDRPVRQVERKGRDSGIGGTLAALVGGAVIMVGGAAVAYQQLGARPARRTYARR